jgi:hypothetical protein
MARSNVALIAAFCCVAAIALRSTPASAAPGDLLWVSTHDGPGGRLDRATALAVDPLGRRIYVTGESRTLDTAIDFTTVAYDAQTGEELWVARYDGPLHHRDRASAIAVGPGGGRVFVTGSSGQRLDDSDWATVAYDAASGDELWSHRMDLGTTGHDYARDLAFHVGRVFVTGENGDDGLTLAYDAGTGDVLWRARITRKVGADTTDVEAFGQRVFVAGIRYTWRGSNVLVRSLAADTGQPIWTRVFRGTPGGTDQVGDAVVSANGLRWYVAVMAEVQPDVFQTTTVAYRTSDGQRLWTRTIGVETAGVQGVPIIATFGGTVAVATTGQLQPSAGVFVTRLYGPSGNGVWTAVEDAAGQTGTPRGIAFTVGGESVVVTGTGSDIATETSGALTKAYASSNGLLQWTAFEPPARRGDGNYAIGVAPDDTVYVAGEMARDYFTAAYLSA